VSELNNHCFCITALGAPECVLVVTQFVAGLNLGEKYWQPTNRASTRADWGRNRRIVVVWKFHSALLTCTGKSANGSPSHRRLAKPLSMMMEP
jgi:hypothetical protein